MNQNALKIGNSGRKPDHPELEAVLKDFVGSAREKSIPVTFKNMARKAMQLLPGKWRTIERCRDWCYGTADRMGISLRRKTHDEKTGMSEQEMGEIHLDFVMHIRMIVDEFSGALCLSSPCKFGN